MQTIKYICIYSIPESTIKDLTKKHIKQGCFGLRWHYVIERVENGRITEGRPLTQPGVHQDVMDASSWAIAVMGNPRTHHQQQKLNRLLKDLRTKSPDAVVMEMN